MRKYLTELHMHTADSSGCARVYAKDAVEKYIAEGYDTVVITDHFQFPMGCTLEDYNKRCDILRLGWQEAVKAANGRINVLRGAEMRVKENDNDYLVFGVDDAFFTENPQMRTMNIEELCEFVHSKGLLIFQAHPFRVNMTVTDPAILDGVEVFNGNPRHNSRNSIADTWADLHGHKKISGSDFHEADDPAIGGIYTDVPVTDSETLLKILRSGEYEIKKK